MYAVILAGGGGTRLWPLSRRARPKPFLPLVGDDSLFRLTLRRIAPLIAPADAYVVVERGHLDVVSQDAPELGHGQLLAEPVGRNTAAAVALAAVAIERPADEVMVVLPADAYVTDEDAFRAALAAAAGAAAAGALVTLGIRPAGPETGYGYIVGTSGSAGAAVREVERFVEKPERQRALELLASPAGAWWNAGIFVWRRDALLDGLERHAPQTLAPIRGARGDAQTLADAYATLPQISIDRALLEPASVEGRVKVVPADIGWSDLGSWSALHAELARRQPGGAGVVAVGRAEDVDSSDVLVHSSAGRLVVTVGLRGTIVVDTPDVVLVCDIERAQDVRVIVDRLVAAEETDHL